MQRALEGLPGVAAVSVSLEGGTASLEYDPARIAPEAMTQAVRAAVLLPRGRRLLERLARRWRRDPS